MSIPLSLAVSIFEALAATVVSGTAVKGVIDAIHGLRAKTSAKRLIEAKHDGKLTYLAKQALKRELKEEEVKAAGERILGLIEEMPKRDVALVERGISQPSRSGERRYVQELIRHSVQAEHDRKGADVARRSGPAASLEVPGAAPTPGRRN